MTGATIAGGAAAPAELWARADATGARSAECLARSDSFTAWVKDNKTYIYDHARNTVLVEPAITMGLSPWLGPKFLTTLSKLPNYNAVKGDDPFRDRSGFSSPPASKAPGTAGCGKSKPSCSFEKPIRTRPASSTATMDTRSWWSNRRPLSFASFVKQGTCCHAQIYFNHETSLTALRLRFR
jgi:hypothetical protein